MKNPFKKSSITDTLVNVGIGGAANAAMDYAVASGLVPASAAGYTNYIKLGVGVLGGTMISGKVARAAFDGLATVGASDIIKELIAGSETADSSGEETADSSGEKTALKGLPFIGATRRRMGQRGFRSVRGTGDVAFMS